MMSENNDIGYFFWSCTPRVNRHMPAYPLITKLFWDLCFLFYTPLITLLHICNVFGLDAPACTGGYMHYESYTILTMNFFHNRHCKKTVWIYFTASGIEQCCYRSNGYRTDHLLRGRICDHHHKGRLRTAWQAGYWWEWTGGSCRRKSMRMRYGHRRRIESPRSADLRVRGCGLGFYKQQYGLTQRCVCPAVGGGIYDWEGQWADIHFSQLSVT